MESLSRRTILTKRRSKNCVKETQTDRQTDRHRQTQTAKNGKNIAHCNVFNACIIPMYLR